MFKGLKIRQQFTLLVVVVTGLTILLTVIFILLLSRITDLAQQADILNQAEFYASEMAIATQYTAHDTNAYALGHLEHRQEFVQHVIRFDTALTDIANIRDKLADEERALLDTLILTRTGFTEAANELFEAADRVSDATTETERLTAITLRDEAWEAQDGLGNELDALSSTLASSLRMRLEEGREIQVQLVQIANLVSFLLPTLIIGSSLVIMITIRNSISQSLETLSQAARKIASGTYSERVSINSQDEIGQLSQSFNTMAEAIEYRDKVQIVKLEERVVETQAARERAEQSEQVKAAFLASMSHELRTPLNAVINFTRFVVEGDTGPVNEQQVELLTEVVNSGKHLLNLINDVLDMSKIEAKSLNLFIEDDVDVTAIITTAMTTGRALLGDKPVELITSVTENLPPIQADRQRILQVMLNIVSNACKFTDAGQIKLRAYTVDDELVISVEDTGQGIAAEDQEMVFEAFKQTQSGLREGSGTGLGMPIARNLTEAHGGHMWLESTVGQGTTFYVALPIKAETLEPAMNQKGVK